MRRLFIVFLLSFCILSGRADYYGDIKFYLVDSIVVSELPMADQLLLNTLLKKVHKADSDTLKYRLLTDIARESNTPELGLKYNNYILKHIGFTNDTTYIKFKISSYSHIALIYSRLGDFRKSTDNYNEAIKHLRYLNSEELNSIIDEEKAKEIRTVMIVSASIIGVLIIFFWIIFNRYRVIKYQKDIIDKQAEEVEKKRVELDKKNNQISKSLKDIQLLNDIGKKITGTLSDASLVDVTFISIKELFDIDVYGIGRYNDQNNSIDFLS